MSNKVISRPLPSGSLLETSRDDEGAFADCYSTDVPAQVELAEFVRAFYTTPLFRTERWLLAMLARAPSDDLQADQLARGEIDRFAIWVCEHRTDSQLVMRQTPGRTRSWFMVQPFVDPSDPGTRLYFGTGVSPRTDRRTGKKGIGTLFVMLSGLHVFYSRALLASARKRVMLQSGR